MKSFYLWAATVFWAASAAAGAGPLVLTGGDRVVFVGATLVERDAQQGYLEANLNVRFPTSAFTFRNLGWSGDDVWGNARAEFGSQADGYKKLIDEVAAAKPTVLLIQYGTNESFAGQAGVAGFLAQYEALLNDLAKSGPKVWLIGPSRLEDLGGPLPDPARHNDDVKRYSDAIKALAAKRGLGFVDLYDAPVPQGGTHLTDDTMHFTTYGAKWFAEVTADALCGVDAKPISGPAFDALREKAIEKNRQFFYRWRPQNDTYIFGFRKYEQGQNAVEIPQFDPIVQKLEAEIAEMKKTLPAPTK